MRRPFDRQWRAVCALGTALAAATLTATLAPEASAAVLCQRKNTVKVRPDTCKKKETLVQNLGQLGTDVSTQGSRVTELVGEFRLACVAAPNLTQASSALSFYHDNIDCGGGCRTHDGNQTACVGAFALSNDGATSCFYFKGFCLPCADCGERQGACTNACRPPATPVTCPADPSRTVFAGGPRTEACRNITTQPECEQAFHATRNGSPATCYWTGSRCEGCGPRNENDQECTNSCRTIGCADASRTTLRRCTNIGGDPVACAQAWHLSGRDGEPASCWFDTDDNQCRGCGLPHELRGDCDNTCR